MLRGYGREEAYRGGNKVYRSGMNSPHQGTKLDPSGYVNRELNKPRVDRRSRLAATALNRQRDGRDGGKQGNGPRSPAGTKPKNPGNGPRVGQGTQWYPIGTTSDDKGGKGGKGNTPTEPEPPDPFSPPKVDLNGKLLPMPWEMQMDWINATNSLAQQNAQWDAEVQSANTDLNIALRDLARQKIVDQRNLAGNNAGRGMSFSSGNAYGIENMANDYATAESDTRNYVQDLLGRIGVGGTDRALAQGQYDQYAANLQAEAARRLAQRAGTLGLGEDNTDTGGEKKPKTVKQYKKTVKRLSDNKHDKADLRKFNQRTKDDRPGWNKAINRAVDGKHDKKNQRKWIKRHTEDNDNKPNKPNKPRRDPDLNLIRDNKRPPRHRRRKKGANKR